MASVRITHLKRITSAILVVATVMGCTAVRLSTDIRVDSQVAAEKIIPVRVALYISPEVKSFRHGVSGLPDVVYLGEGLSSNSENVLRVIFKEVTTVGVNEASFKNANYDAVISPQIVDSYLKEIGMWAWGCNVTVKWTVTDLSGKVLYMNTISGDSELRRFSTAFTMAKAKGDCMTMALEDHYKLLLSHLTTVPWWSKPKSYAR